MKMTATWWATLALAGTVSGHAFGQIRSIEVQPAPVHEAIDSDDDTDAAGVRLPGGGTAAAEDPSAGPALAEAPPPAAEARSADAGRKVAISRKVIDAAGAFDGYMRRASAIRPQFADGSSVARAVAQGSVYEPNQLGQGAIAYAALVALQDPDFVHAVQDAGADPAARGAFADRLVDQPETVLAAGAARREATRVSHVIGHMAVDLVMAGSAVKQASYDLQSQGWSKGAILSPTDRLARIKAESATPLSLRPADQAHLITSLAAYRASGAGDSPEAETATATVVRGMALAALAVLGEAGDDQAQRIDALMNDPLDAQCLKMARLNDFQCLAVAGPHYENLFCLGRHGMMETGECIATAAGSAGDPQMMEAVDNRSVYVPVAETAASDPANGPERSSVFDQARPAGVDVPVAAPAAPVNYSPYDGPTDP